MKFTSHNVTSGNPLGRLNAWELFLEAGLCKTSARKFEPLCISVQTNLRRSVLLNSSLKDQHAPVCLTAGLLLTKSEPVAVWNGLFFRSLTTSRCTALASSGFSALTADEAAGLSGSSASQLKSLPSCTDTNGSHIEPLTCFKPLCWRIKSHYSHRICKRPLHTLWCS